MKATAWLFDRFCDYAFGASIICHVLNRFPCFVKGHLWHCRGTIPVCHRELSDPNDAPLLNAGPILGMFVEWLHEMWFSFCIPVPAHTSCDVMTGKTGKSFKEEFKQKRTNCWLFSRSVQRPSLLLSLLLTYFSCQCGLHPVFITGAAVLGHTQPLNRFASV